MHQKFCLHRVNEFIKAHGVAHPNPEEARKLGTGTNGVSYLVHDMYLEHHYANADICHNGGSDGGRRPGSQSEAMVLSVNGPQEGA